MYEDFSKYQSELSTKVLKNFENIIKNFEELNVVEQKGFQNQQFDFHDLLKLIHRTSDIFTIFNPFEDKNKEKIDVSYTMLNSARLDAEKLWNGVVLVPESTILLKAHIYSAHRFMGEVLKYFREYLKNGNI